MRDDGISETSQIIPVTTVVRAADTPQNMAEAMNELQQMKAAILTERDVVEIKGKPYTTRSGLRKLALAFNVSDEIKSTEKETDDDGNITWRIQVRAWAPNGRSVLGIGACSSKEREFVHPDHDIYAIAHTRAKNRAISDLIGSGEVSAEEMKASIRDKAPSPVPTGESPPKTNPQPKYIESEQTDPYIIDQQTVLNLLEDKGLDTTTLNIFWYAEKLRIDPHDPLGENWQAYNEALAPLKPEWIKLGNQGRWEVTP